MSGSEQRIYNLRHSRSRSSSIQSSNNGDVEKKTGRESQKRQRTESNVKFFSVIIFCNFNKRRPKVIQNVLVWNMERKMSVTNWWLERSLPKYKKKSPITVVRNFVKLLFFKLNKATRQFNHCEICSIRMVVTFKSMVNLLKIKNR